MSGSPGSTRDSRLLGLELLRFLCAVGVLIYHFQHFMFVGSDHSPVMINALPLSDWAPVQATYRFGYLGVQVFWCISGYIFFWKYRVAIGTQAVSGWRFLVLRFSRLYPLHIATLLAVALLQAWHLRSTGSYFVYGNNSVADFLPHLAMASNWFSWQPYSFNGPIWSVSLEVLVYVLFYFATRYSRGDWRAALVLFLVSVMVSVWTRNNLVLCTSLFYGGGMAALARHALASQQRIRTIERLAIALLLAACVALWLLRFHNSDWFAWRHLQQCIVPLTVFILAADFRVLHPWTTGIQMLGNMTYSSYLIHFPVQLATAVGFAMMGAALPYTSLWMLIAYMVVVLALAVILYRYFELPAQGAIRRVG